MLKLFLKLVIFIVFYPKILYAVDYLDLEIENIIYSKFNNTNYVLDINYQNLDKVNNIKELLNSNSSQMKGLELIKLDTKNNSFKVKINYLENNINKTEEITGLYQLFMELPVVSRTLKSGLIINSSDIDYIKIKASDLRNNQYITKKEDAIGMVTKRLISAGSLIKFSDIIKPNVIKPNDPVSIIYKSNNITLKTSGIALTAGGIGDMIKVKNAETGAPLLGQIINKNTVQVGWND